MHDPRIHLEPLRAEDLHNIARNSAAAHRLLAVRMLVERGSALACSDELVADARAAILDDPCLLRMCRENGMDPALITKLPGILDLIIHERQACVALAATVGNNRAAHAQELATLAATVGDNNAAHNSALAEQSCSLSKAIAQQREQIQTNIDAHQQALDVTNTRLARLERSLWRKCVDWWKER